MCVCRYPWTIESDEGDKSVSVSALDRQIVDLFGAVQRVLGEA